MRTHGGICTVEISIVCLKPFARFFLVSHIGCFIEPCYSGKKLGQTL